MYVLPLLIVINAQAFLFIHLNRTQMNLYAFIASNSLQHFTKSILPCLKGLHKHIVSLFYLFFKEEPQELSLEEFLDSNSAFSEGLIFVSNASHPPKGNDLINCPYLPFFSVKFSTDMHRWPCWQVNEAVQQFIFA